MTALLLLGGMVVTVALASALKLIVHAPTFFVSWMAVATGAAIVAARRTRGRARCYSVGARLDADAFGLSDVDLVRRVGRRDDYDVGLVPGMMGTFEHGRSPLAVEALTRSGPVRVPLPAEGKVRIDFGAVTFVIRRRADAPEPVLPWGERLRRAGKTARSFLPLAGSAAPLAAAVTFLAAVPAALALSEADMRSAIPAGASQWEVEQHIRARAQRQVGALHQCFDPLPLRCQRPGYVGVGLSLSKDGEVRRQWVARSTYGNDCPVSQCMVMVVSSWYFEPMPAPMNLVLPVQVRRTNKPLYDPRAVIAHPVVLGDPFGGDAGAIELIAD